LPQFRTGVHVLGQDGRRIVLGVPEVRCDAIVNERTLADASHVVALEGAVATIWEKLDAVHEYTFLAERFPRFIAAFGPLADAIRQTFSCGLDEGTATSADIAVFGLGRLCLEDFGEILFLSEHDYGYAAIKLLRGLYERAVVSEIIVENPTTQGERFVNYYVVDAMKFRNRAKSAYKRHWKVKDDSDLEKEFGEVKKDYKRQQWTDQSLDALAGSLGKQSPDKALQKLGDELRNLYLVCASLPNSHIHASMFSIIQRLADDVEGRLCFEEGGQLDQVEIALSQAHGLIILALHVQNQHFRLGLDESLQSLLDDRCRTWPVEGSTRDGDVADER
jgi:hypothetical protein